ncbi:hypothetical protein Bca52824_056293 [Brassica carinata]|uniref:Uncharacterized protein n=1 Tax=Brassica carinata TaxID=52824 RepID=A0A8X7QU49_BRACI|nr:hypothetical protein Bca52824_056293 [Brassica carinata]
MKAIKLSYLGHSFYKARAALRKNLRSRLPHRTHSRCSYNRSPAYTLGFASAIFLMMAQIIASVGSGCFCCRKGVPAHTRSNNSRPSCYGDSCTPSDHLRHQKSIMKSQRNALLIASALTFYWILYSVTNPVVRIEQINQRDERLRNRV